MRIPKNIIIARVFVRVEPRASHRRGAKPSGHLDYITKADKAPSTLALTSHAELLVALIVRCRRYTLYSYASFSFSLSFSLSLCRYSTHTHTPATRERTARTHGQKCTGARARACVAHVAMTIAIRRWRASRNMSIPRLGRRA